jgi:hypothetical protein
MQIFLFALILRFVPVVTMRSMGIGLDDMFQYDMLARSIVATAIAGMPRQIYHSFNLSFH